MVLLCILCNNMVSSSYLFYSKFLKFWGVQNQNRVSERLSFKSLAQNINYANIL